MIPEIICVVREQGIGNNIPYQFLVMLPYAIALLALVRLAGKSTPPKALGIPYFTDNHKPDLILN